METDSELESQARAQAAAIAAAQDLALANQTAAQSFWRSVGRVFGVKDLTPEVVIQKPGRELLLWQMKQNADLKTALPLAYTLLEEGRFMNTVPNERECPIHVFQARRKWNDAAKEWAQMGGGDKQAWLRCDRKLMLRKQNGVVRIVISRKDLCVKYDTKAAKLVPVRVENTEVIDSTKMAEIIEKFPNLTVVHLVEGMRVPTRYFNSSQKGRADAYVADGPILPGFELYLMDKKKKTAKDEDPSKGLATWLASVLKSSAAK